MRSLWNEGKAARHLGAAERAYRRQDWAGAAARAGQSLESLKLVPEESAAFLGILLSATALLRDAMQHLGTPDLAKPALLEYGEIVGRLESRGPLVLAQYESLHRSLLKL